jgi:hypothetical protein
MDSVFWDVMPCGFVRTDVSEEHVYSIIREKRIGELATTLAVISNRTTLQITIRHAFFWMLPCVAIVRADVSEEHIFSITWVTRIGELATTLAVTTN